jgi:hypothetical protein
MHNISHLRRSRYCSGPEPGTVARGGSMAGMTGWDVAELQSRPSSAVVARTPPHSQQTRRSPTVGSPRAVAGVETRWDS